MGRKREGLGFSTCCLSHAGNAVWEDEHSAKRALIGLGQQPLGVLGEEEASKSELS